MSPEDYKKMRAYMRNIRKKCIVIILMIIISISISPVIGGDNQSTNNQSISNKSINNQSGKKPINYRIAIDQYRGFYRVYIANTSGRVVPISYNGTLNITKGDTITWMNDAVPDARLTVISQQKLWSDNSGILKWAYKQFGYTFNKSGIYDVYIKENSKFKQKIIVGPLESSSTNKTKTNISSSNKNVSKLNSTIDNPLKTANTTNKTKTNISSSNKKTKTNISSSNKKTKTNISSSNKNVLKLNSTIDNPLKTTNATNKIVNATNSPKNDEINIGKYNMFMILPMIAIISIIYIRKFQKKAK